MTSAQSLALESLAGACLADFPSALIWAQWTRQLAAAALWDDADAVRALVAGLKAERTMTLEEAYQEACIRG